MGEIIIKLIDLIINVEPTGAASCSCGGNGNGNGNNKLALRAPLEWAKQSALSSPAAPVCLAQKGSGDSLLAHYKFSPLARSLGTFGRRPAQDGAFCPN